MALAPVASSRVPCAATASVAAALDGPLRIGRVLAGGPHAVYAQLDDRVLAVLTGSAVAVPVGLATPWARLPAHDGRLVVGHGALRLGEHHLHVARLVDRRVPDLPGLAGVPAQRLLSVDRRTAPARADLDHESLARLAAGDPDSVDDLLGRGSGLTPTGDDVLAAWLVTRRAAGLPRDAVGIRVAERAAAATTAISAALLSRALAAEAVPQLTDVLRVLARPGSDVDAAADRLAAIGHTSGAGLLLGVLLALSDTSPSPPDRSTP